MKKLLVPVCLAALSASALDLAAWRGETVCAWVPAGETVGTAPDGFAVKVGVARDVKYAPVPKKPERKVAADRVEWGSTAAGPKVVEIKVPVAAKPGVYALGDVKVRVVDHVLPPAAKWSYFLDLWQHPWAVSRAAGVKPFSKEHYAAMKPLWELLASAGQKSLTTSIVDLPWNHQCHDGYEAMVKYTRRADGSTAFDWSTFDEYVAFGKACGIGPWIACYTMCPWEYQVSWYDEAGKIQKAKAVPGTPFFKAYWGPFLKAFAAHLKEKGWYDETMISLDERSPEDLKNTVEFLHEMAPGLRIAMAGNRKPSDFDGIQVDNYCQALGFVKMPGFLDEVPQRRAKGLITTYYVCCGPAKPNTFMDSELDESFWCGVYPAMCGLDGFLRWAYNSWPADACADVTYDVHGWRSGDVLLVYPDGSPSARFLELRNGIQQAEKFNILMGMGVRTAELKALAGKYSDLNAALNKKDGDFKELIRETKEILNRDDAPAAPNTLTEAEKAEGWKLLWDGRTAAGWVGVRSGCRTFPEKGWTMKDGVLTVLPSKCIKNGKWENLPPEQAALGGGGDIVTEKEYRDFMFKLDFRLTPCANSGIKYFFKPNANKGTCEEYQILDPGHPDSSCGRNGNRRVASLYDLMSADAEKIVRPAGEWNTAMVVSKGDQVEHWLNGVKVLSYTRGSADFRTRVAASKYATWGTDGRKWGELESGRILIQDHSDSTVSFRNIKIREL